MATGARGVKNWGSKHVRWRRGGVCAAQTLRHDERARAAWWPGGAPSPKALAWRSPAAMHLPRTSGTPPEQDPSCLHARAADAAAAAVTCFVKIQDDVDTAVAEVAHLPHVAESTRGSQRKAARLAGSGCSMHRAATAPRPGRAHPVNQADGPLVRCKVVLLRLLLLLLLLRHLLLPGLRHASRCGTSASSAHHTPPVLHRIRAHRALHHAAPNGR